MTERHCYEQSRGSTVVGWAVRVANEWLPSAGGCDGEYAAKNENE